MGSKKKNAGKTTTGQKAEKVTQGKSNATSNGVKQKSSEARLPKPRKENQALSGPRWVAIILLSSLVASVAIYYASPEAQKAVNDLITRYSKIDILQELNSESSDPGPVHETEDSPNSRTVRETNKASSSPGDPQTEASQQTRDQKQDGRQNPAQSETVSLDKEEKSAEKSSKIHHDKDHSKGETERDEQIEEERAEEDSGPARGSSKTERQKDDHVYSRSDITNSADFQIRKELDEIDSSLEQNKIEQALERYNELTEQYPKSPRALYGKAMALDKLSEIRRSNEVLELCLNAFKKLLELDDVPDKLYKKAGLRLADRQQFRGYSPQASKTYNKLVEKFPTDISLLNKLGVSHLMTGAYQDGKEVFRKVLKINPRDGFAMVHLGFALKIADVNNVEAVPLLEQGIKSRAEGTKDSRFYYHLGDALQRLGNYAKAHKYYQEGASLGLFLSAYQRSIYNVNHLRSHPWWTVSQTGHKDELGILKDSWKEIREEALAQMSKESGLFKPEDENLREKGDWKQFTLFSQGRRNKAACEKMPLTCSLVEKIPDATGCKRGQVKFSVMQPGVHVWPHCGPTNCRIRAHLGLVVPEGPRIRVVNETRTWKEGEFLIFDDSFEHEVWHEGTEQRLVLIVDLWHPELSSKEKQTLSPI